MQKAIHLRNVSRGARAQALVVSLCLALCCSSAPAAESATGTVKPPAVEEKSPGEHPLDPALAIARDGVRRLQENVRDYTATLVKRERIKKGLGEYQYLHVKVRHRRNENGRTVVPFSVYVRFLAPDSVAGREVIWVEGQNDDKLIAHETGIKNLLRVNLEPTGFLAMMGNRYPISKIGMLHLAEEMLAKGSRDRQYGECEVQFFDNAKVDGRACQLIRVTHPQRRPYFEFYRAEIFVDRELNVPIRYAAWTWPAEAGGEPVLEEEYNYRDVQLNVGLTDRDFDPDNPAYKFP
jgi:hypothetical protein